jgi:hypothetical protein
MLRELRTLLVVAFTLVTLVAAVAWQGASSPEQESAGRLPVLRGAGPTWYKGNLHTHSFWSDGDDFPEMIADWYKRQGYHFLGLSDHNILAEGDKWVDITDKGTRPVALKKYRARFGSSWVEERDLKGKKQVRLKPLAEFRSLLEEPGKFLLVPAEEVTHGYNKRPVHMNAINLRDVIKPVDGASVAETISVNHRLIAEQAKKTRRRMLTFLNHPNWGWGINAEDMIPIQELRFFEVFNGHPGIRNEGDKDHPSCDRLWDIVLALRLGKHGLGPVHGLATDDAHRYHEWGVGKVNPGRGWIMVKGPYLSAEALVRAIDAGDFYATTGVVLDDVKRTNAELALTIRGEPGGTDSGSARLAGPTSWLARISSGSRWGNGSTRGACGSTTQPVMSHTTQLAPSARPQRVQAPEIALCPTTSSGSVRTRRSVSETAPIVGLAAQPGK